MAHPPRRGLLYHFTHIDNLPSIIRHGLRSDTLVRADRSLAVEIGKDNIKSGRRQRTVPVRPGGVVADYVPFYFAPRSPMLYTVTRGNVPTYQGGQEPLVYLLTDCDHLLQVGSTCVFTDRNPYWEYAAYFDDIRQLDELVDWDLMAARIWKNTVEEPDRVERRMAELLVHELVPFEAILGIAVHDAATQTRVEQLLAQIAEPPVVAVRADWYF